MTREVENTNDQHPLQGLKDQYEQLCAERDRRYAVVQPLEDELTLVNAEIAEKQKRAHELAAQIEAGWGGEQWLIIKKQIAALARALGAPGGLLATKPKD